MESLWVLAFAASIALCGSQLQHYTKSPDEHNCDNRVCEYVYSFEMTQFKENDQPLTMSTTVQIMCESTGTYGSLSATRYCMSVSDVGGSILTFRGNQTTEADNRETLMREYALERLSGWFCFVQTSFGQVVSVFHSTTEEVEVVNIKKGIASAFQANLRGTTEETEIDPQSKHTSHYSYPDSVDNVRKMRRTIDSEDIIEFPMHIPTRDVKLHEEEDIEYKDGRLIKSNGTLHLSIDSSTSRLEGSDEFSNAFTAHGSFSMELKICRISARFSRKRRAIQKSVDGIYSVEENLMATFDERKMELEKLETLRRDLKTPQQILTALQNIHSGKNFKALGQVMVLERKYGVMGVPVIDTVLYYLRKIQSEEDVTQRVAIYSLLSSEGSTRAENALMERLQGDAVSDLEKQSIILAISLLPTPSPHVIQTLEEMISQSGNGSSTLLLAYGAIVANAPSTQKERMVSFLTDLLPPVTSESTHGVIHVLHALGNTKSSLAVEHIVQYLWHEDENVRVTAVTALRFFTARPDTQRHLLDMLHDSSDSMVEAIVHALRDGYEYNREMPLDQELIESLANVTINLGNYYLQDELMYFLRAVGTRSSLALVDLIVSSRAEEARLKRASSTDWDDPSSEYEFICPLSERQADVINFPSHLSYLWSKTVGKDEGDHKIYLKSGVGLFAGGNKCNCDFKTLGKAVVRGHLLGWEADAVKILVYVLKHDGTIRGKAYVKFVGSVLLDVDIPPSYTYQLPQYDLTLFSVSYTFTVYIVPVTLSASLTVRIGGEVFAGLEVGETGSIKGTVSFTPSVTATVDASASASIFVAKVGIFLTGTITYSISAWASVAVCRPQNPWFVEVCVGADHGWSPISITVGAFYQLRTWTLSWGRRRTWSRLTYTWTLPGSGRLLIFEMCTNITDGGESTPTTCPLAAPVSTSSTTPTASWAKYRPTPTPSIIIPYGSGADEPAPPTKPPLTKPKPFFPSV
jgi:HEAT repeat protein